MTLEQLNGEFRDLFQEIKSRSGLVSNKTSGNLHTIVAHELVERLVNLISKANFNEEINKEEISRYKEEYLNRWMILHHEYVVRKQHFNWNWP